DVVEEVLDPQILHPQVETVVDLPADEVGILGQEEDALARRELEGLRTFHEGGLRVSAPTQGWHMDRRGAKGAGGTFPWQDSRVSPGPYRRRRQRCTRRCSS